MDKSQNMVWVDLEMTGLNVDKHTIVEADRVRTVYNWFQHFSPEGLEKEFTEAGFSVAEFCSDVAGTEFQRDSDEFAVIAKRA